MLLLLPPVASITFMIQYKQTHSLIHTRSNSQRCVRGVDRARGGADLHRLSLLRSIHVGP
jgi:hypothetical protein